jgi:hypothetical protein
VAEAPKEISSINMNTIKERDVLELQPGNWSASRASGNDEKTTAGTGHP